MKQHSAFSPGFTILLGSNAPFLANKLDAISATRLFPCGIDLSHFSEMCSLAFQSPSYISSEEIISNLETSVDGIHIMLGKELSFLDTG